MKIDKSFTKIFLLLLISVMSLKADLAEDTSPIESPGSSISYTLKNIVNAGSAVQEFELIAGEIEEISSEDYQWLELRAKKFDGSQFIFWMLTKSYPSPDYKLSATLIKRYILKTSEGRILEFENKNTERGSGK